MIGIYKIENLVNGKKYIGQSVDIEDRWRDHKWLANNSYSAKYPLYNAIRKYGLNNFDFSVIEECEINQLNNREIYWIEYYKTFVYQTNSQGYNLTRGGDGNKRLPQEYVDWFIELWKENFSTGEIAKITRKDKHLVIQYLKWYETSYSLKESQKRGHINSEKKHQKAIIQYDFLGREIKRFNSVKEAVEKTNFSENGIRNSLKCKTKGTKNYYFIYDDNNKTDNLKTLINIPNNKKGFFPIIQTDLNDNFVNYFLTLKDAANSVNGTDSVISACARGIYQTAYNYKWHLLTFDSIEKYNLKEIIPLEVL